MTGRFPIDDLSFRASAFADPDGADTFGGIEWRAAEVRRPAPEGLIEKPRHEIRAAWEHASAEPDFEMTIPIAALRIGSTYRVRARTLDETGRASHWSEPVEFVAGEPTAPVPAQGALRISELMYNPIGGGDFEFVEVRNIGAGVIDLADVALTNGVEFEFGEGSVPELSPGEYVLAVGDLQTFATRYPDVLDRVAGEYSGQLSNGGERVELTYGESVTILDFVYSDEWHPLTDGVGHSLVIADELAEVPQWSVLEGWRESAELHGSPGTEDGDRPPGGLRIPGDLNADGRLDIGDPVKILVALFRGGVELPCDGATITDGGNLAMADVDGDGNVLITDAVRLLGYLFLGGEAHTLGARCRRVEGCSDGCGGAE